MRISIDLNDSLLEKVDDIANTTRHPRKIMIELIIENYFLKNIFKATQINLGEGKNE